MPLTDGGGVFMLHSTLVKLEAAEPVLLKFHMELAPES